MKFTCSKELLNRHLQFISRIITARSTLPVLSNILLETDKNILRITGTDLELAMTTYLPAEVEQEGTFTVPAKIFQEFVHQNPDETISFTLESFELIGKSNKVLGRISGLDSEEFPSLPKVEKSTLVRLPFQEMIEALKQVVTACALDQSRPVLTGVYVRLTEDVMTLAATDSFRLVERKVPIVPVQQDFTLLIPMRAIQEIIRIGASFPNLADLELEVSEQQLLFRIDTIELFSQLIAGNFPKYSAIIPQTFQAIVDVTTSELVQALRLSTVFSQSGITNVMIEIGEDGSITITSYGSQRGSAKHTVYAITQEGFTPLKAAFNAKFLLDACNASNSAHLQLRFSGSTSALVVGTEDESFLGLVMPIRLDS